MTAHCRFGIALAAGLLLFPLVGTEAQDGAPLGQIGPTAPRAAPAPVKLGAVARPQPPARGNGAGKRSAAKCQRAAFRVVIDVGHTVDVPGAISAHGVPEYTFNLQLGEAIRQALADAGFTQTELMITEKPPPTGLVERAARANAWGADLFLAVHHDSVPDSLLQTWQFNGQELHYNDDYPGYALFISHDNADRAGSLLFGDLLGKALQARGLHYTPHYTLPLMGSRRRELLDPVAGVYRYDQLVVLRDTHMPAVLIEAGSIINRQEELELATPERRATTSAAVAAAVEDFCDARPRVTAVRQTRAPHPFPPAMPAAAR